MFYQRSNKEVTRTILDIFWIGFLIVVILTQLYIEKIEVEKSYGSEEVRRG